MGLFQKAYETYENHQYLAGVSIEGKEELLPVAHIFMNAGLELTLNKKGELTKAALIEKADAKTIIPVTIESGGRSGKNPPAHPLCDKLSYMLKDNGNKYQDYHAKLTAWAESDYTDIKLKIIKEYIESGRIINDLKTCSLWKGDKKDKKLLDMVVRWRIEGLGETATAECWKDGNLFSLWEGYYLSVLAGKEASQNKDICMIIGEKLVITDNHPKNIVSFNANAKLISANDTSNFTYRGRFLDGTEACSIGYLSSQKAHNALRWLVDKGYSLFGRSYLCWNPKGKHLPEVWSPLDFDKKEPIASPTDYKKQLKNTLAGYRNNLPDTEDVIIASVDAATNGRMAVTYYNELRASDFLDRIESWYLTCCWNSGKYGIKTPTINEIVKAAYGIEREGRLEANDLIFKDNAQRLVKCLTEKAAIPYDIVRQLLQRASMPQAYDKRKYDNYARLLVTACAVIRKYYNDKSKREEWSLELDRTKTDKDYLFGRLLAVMEKVERDTYEANEEREPNAIRMQAAFCERPFYYTHIIHQRLEPYFTRHKPSSRIYFKNEIGEIMEKLAEFDDNELNKPLNEKYVMGYYLQRAEMYKSKKKEIKEEE